MADNARTGWMVLAVAVVLAAGGCAHAGKAASGKASREDGEERHTAGAKRTAGGAAVELPWDTTAGRDDESAPIVKLDRASDDSVVPYLYGYPLYAAGGAIQGVKKLRQDNWTGATREVTADEQGVQHVVEFFPELGCTFEGIQQSETQYVPRELRCVVPAPDRLGGKARRVVGGLDAKATPADVIKDPNVGGKFYGDWHLTEGELDRGTGTGYFNTAHGQLGFGFEKGHLASVVYQFDAPDTRWRKPELWVEP